MADYGQQLRVINSRLCALEKITSGLGVLLQFTVGESIDAAIFSGDKNLLTLPSDGSYNLIIRAKNIKKNSIQVFWDGNFMLPYRNDRESYTPNTTVDVLTITRTGAPFMAGQTYTIFYGYN